MSIFLRWGVPAFITVIGGTAAAIATSGTMIPVDLETRANAAIAGDVTGWAHVDFDMRDAVLTGTATSQEVIDTAVARVAEIRGVRSVTSNVALAEYASPYPFLARVANGSITLSGALPDEAARAELLALAGEGAIDEMRPMSGAPDRDAWLAAVRKALAYASEMDEGEVALSDLTLSASGRARTAMAYEQLKQLAATPTPAGVSLGFHDFTPPLQSPYQWHAEFDGHRLILSGAVPGEAVASRMETSIAKGTEVANSLVLASGAPEAFESRAAALIENLLKLESGSASISDTESTLSGAPRDAASADAVRLAMTPMGTSLTLSPPGVEKFWFSAARASGQIVLDGYVSDAAMQDRLSATPGVNAEGLELARGASDRFASAVDFVIDNLQHMSEGTARIEGTSITLAGRAASSADFDHLETALNLGAPQGLILAQTAIKPPLAAPFIFTIEKAADGAFSMSGHVPSRATRRVILSAVAGGAADATTIADGQPTGFEAAATEAIAVLALLDSGKVSYDGAGWSLTGAASSAAEASAAEVAFAETGLRSAGWSYSVELPVVETAALPIIEPYTWRAQKAPTGAVTLSGFVPTEQLKVQLVAESGAGAVDGTALGAGAPETFATDVLAGVAAIQALSEGSISYAAGDWVLSGKVATTAERHAIEAALSEAADSSLWHVAIQAADAAPVVAPFTWSASKSADGAVTLNGYVPAEALRSTLAKLAGTGAVDKSLVGSGEPRGFEVDAPAGLAALLKLKSGELRYDGTHWTISGQPGRAGDAEAVKLAIAGMSKGGEGWTQALAEPVVAEPDEPEVAPVPEPEVTPATGEPAAEQPVTPVVPEEAAEPVAPETEVADLTPAPNPTPAPVERNYVFDGSKVLGGPVSFAGVVPADATRRFLAVITDGEPSDTLAIDSDLPDDFVLNAGAGSRALALLADGKFGLDGDQWVFSGRAETEAQRTAALAELAAVPAGSRWLTDVTLLPPLLVCEDKVTAFAARNAILFQSGSALIDTESLPAIDELAADLSLCPEASVEVEGHTDGDGDDLANLALSVARAEAVVVALMDRGISGDRLYAVGYGESLPIASNETRAGKQANRRIAFTLSDE